MVATKSSSYEYTALSGLALLIAGIVLTLSILGHPDETSHPEALATSLWQVVHFAILVALVLLLFGLVGLFARTATKTGLLGLLGFVIAFAATVLLAGLMITEVSIIPALAQSPSAAQLLDEKGPLLGGLFGLIFLFTTSIYALGSVLYGVALLLSRSVPKLPIVLIILGTPLLAFAPPLPYLLGKIGGAAMGIGWAWLGYFLWSGKH